MKQTKKPEQGEQAYDWSQHQQDVTGFEHTQADDFGLPFLTIVQKGSPEVDKTHKDHGIKAIEGASIGDVIDTQAREIVHREGKPQVIEFVPCMFQKAYVEWKPRTSGGGFVKQHFEPGILTQCKRDEKNRDVLPNGNTVVTTAYFFGLLLREGLDPKPVVIGMSSTQLKKARLWLNLMSGLKVERPDGTKFTPPMFARKYYLHTVAESNAEGSWYGWAIESGEMLHDPKLIGMARDAAKSTSSIRLLAPPAETPDENPSF